MLDKIQTISHRILLLLIWVALPFVGFYTNIEGILYFYYGYIWFYFFLQVVVITFFDLLDQDPKDDNLNIVVIFNVCRNIAIISIFIYYQNFFYTVFCTVILLFDVIIFQNRKNLQERED